MSSDILTIYDNIGAWSLTINGQSVRSLVLDEVQDTIPQPPVRLLLPFGNVVSGIDDESFQHMAITRLDMMEWRIQDLLLFRPVAEGEGLRTAANQLLQYVSTYAVQVADNQHITTQADIFQVTYSLEADRQWGNIKYFAVLCELIVHENIL